MSQHNADSPIALCANGVSIGYGRTTVVANLDLSITRSAFTVLVGPNGCGKSTILLGLAGLLPPQSGTVLLDGHPIASMSSKQLAKRIGVLSQSPVVPEGLTVGDLVQQGRYPHRPLFGRWSPQDDEACAEALHLTGMEAFQDRQIDRLSGGQKQRAWIAMTLAQQTDILLLDEPTTFLDIAHQIEVLDLLVDLVSTRRKTVVAVLHDLNQAARYADHMALLKEGAIISSGCPGKVMTIDAIADVFGVTSRLISDPVTGTPMCILAGKRDQPSTG